MLTNSEDQRISLFRPENCVLLCFRGHDLTINSIRSIVVCKVPQKYLCECVIWGLDNQEVSLFVYSPSVPEATSEVRLTDLDGDRVWGQ